MHEREQEYREFDLLVGRHGKFISFLCQRWSYGQKTCCHDLMQECYISLLEHLPERKADSPRQSELAWVYWRCRHAISHYRQRQRTPATIALTGELADSLAAGSEVTQMTVDELAACLSGKERRCFLLMADGFGDEEIEHMLELKHRSMIQMRHNIKEKIRKHIEQ